MKKSVRFRKLDELSSLGPAGMPNMLDEAKGLRRQFVPNENGEKGPDGKTGVWKAREDAPTHERHRSMRRRECVRRRVPR